MRIIKLREWLCFALLLTSVLSFGQIRLPAIVSSHMVLQRNAEVQLWGWASAGEEVSISTSWFDETVTVKTNSQGRWAAKVHTTNTLKPQFIIFKSQTSTILLEDVLFGEVWLCSGQSNMYQPVKGYAGQPTFGTQQTLVNARNSKLRLFMVEKTASVEPTEDLRNFRKWQSASAHSVADFSAVAYHFGAQLQQMLGVPVGMIHSSWGGSNVKAWMSEDVLQPLEAYNKENLNPNNKAHQQPTLLYNAMIKPLLPYTIKGALWYQGESNRNESEFYKTLLPAMVKGWRRDWAIGDFPFYFVQIAPYKYDGNDKLDVNGNTAFMREDMLSCRDLIPNSGIAITLDIGDKETIHPPRKKEVADRLLYLALEQTYGYKMIDGRSPEYLSMEKTDSNITLSFKNEENGLWADGALKDFEIAGADKVFYPAKAKIVGRKKVLVQSDKVKNPIAVRYAWRNFVVGSLFDTNMLPASSFRTDDWDDATIAQ